MKEISYYVEKEYLIQLLHSVQQLIEEGWGGRGICISDALTIDCEKEILAISLGEIEEIEESEIPWVVIPKEAISKILEIANKYEEWDQYSSYYGEGTGPLFSIANGYFSVEGIEIDTISENFMCGEVINRFSIVSNYNGMKEEGLKIELEYFKKASILSGLMSDGLVKLDYSYHYSYLSVGNCEKMVDLASCHGEFPGYKNQCKNDVKFKYPICRIFELENNNNKYIIFNVKMGNKESPLNAKLLSLSLNTTTMMYMKYN